MVIFTCTNDCNLNITYPNLVLILRYSEPIAPNGLLCTSNEYNPNTTNPNLVLILS